MENCITAVCPAHSAVTSRLNQNASSAFLQLLLYYNNVYICQRSYVFAFVSLSVRRLSKKLSMNFDEIFGTCRM